MASKDYYSMFSPELQELEMGSIWNNLEVLVSELDKAKYRQISPANKEKIKKIVRAFEKMEFDTIEELMRNVEKIKKQFHDLRDSSIDKLTDEFVKHYQKEDKIVAKAITNFINYK